MENGHKKLSSRVRPGREGFWVSQGWVFIGGREMPGPPQPVCPFFSLINFAPSGKEVFWGAWASKGLHEHPRMHSKLDGGDGSEAHPIVLSCSGHLSQRWAA